MRTSIVPPGSRPPPADTPGESPRPGLNRYLRTVPGGLLRVDAGKAKAEENPDGKYLLRAADPHMSAEGIAAGYKQLLGSGGT